MKTLTIIVSLSLALTTGCKKETSVAGDAGSVATSSASAALTPEQLGELGAKIKKQPGDVSKLLSEHGLNEQTFEAEIRRVSADPEASKRYAAAFKQNDS